MMMVRTVTVTLVILHYKHIQNRQPPLFYILLLKDIQNIYSDIHTLPK